MSTADKLVLGEYEFSSRFILGSGKYDLKLIKAAVEEAQAEIITLALRRTRTGSENILDAIPSNVQILPNTSGARTAEQALHIAQLAREMGLFEGCAPMIKIEVIRDNRYLLPDNHETLKAVELLSNDGFLALPYMFPDLTAARDMAAAGAGAIMPLAAPIGSNRGMVTKDLIKMILDEISLPVIVDAGLGRPSEAAYAMEMGCAAVMANTAIASAQNVPAMAKAFRLAIEAGRTGYLAGLGQVVEHKAVASSPLTEFLASDPDLEA